MIVKDLIKFLLDFNPIANVRLIAKGQNEILTFGGWLGDDDTPAEKRNIEFEKLKAKEVYLHLLKEEYPNGATESSQS